MDQPFALAVTGQVTEVAGKKTKASCFAPPPPPSPPPAPPLPVLPGVDLPGCGAVCSADDNFYAGDCGYISQKNDKRWCYHPSRNEEVCCASTSDDCCLPNDPKLIAGVSIAIIVATSLSIIACCYYCCKCFKQDKENKVFPVRRRVDAHYRQRRR